MYALHTIFYCSFSNWNIVELQCCVNLCCMAKGLNYIYILFYFIFFKDFPSSKYIYIKNIDLFILIGG